MTWAWPVPNHVPWEVPSNGHDGAFSTRRRFDVHTGIDIYCPPGAPVHAVEDGTVLRIEKFTGPEMGSEWWLPTECILVRGASGVVNYGEVKPDDGIVPGVKVLKGQRLATVLQVRKPKPTTKPLTMLHLELYEYDEATYAQAPDVSTTVWWHHDHPQPARLLDPTKRLRQAWLQVADRFHRDSPKPPATLAERRALVRWILNHKLWTHEYFMKIHAPGQSMFKKIPDSTHFSMTEPEGEMQDVRDGSFSDCISFTYVYLDPTVERVQGIPVDDEDPRNTDFRVWVEGGGYMDQSKDENFPPPPNGWDNFNRWITCHDLNLDCSGATMEDALIQLALRVKWFYGEGGRAEERITSDSDRFRDDCGSHFENGVLGDTTARYYQHCVDAGDGFCVKCGYAVHPCYHTAREGVCAVCEEEIMPSAVRDELERAEDECHKVLRALRRIEDVNREDPAVRKAASDLYSTGDDLKEAGSAAVMTGVRVLFDQAEAMILTGRGQLARFPVSPPEDD
jgi:hypothetical protein